MSKKNSTKEIAINITGEQLKQLFDQYENLSIHRLADATGTCYQMLLKAARKPIAGVAYDPDAQNYDEMAKVFNRRDVKFEELDFEELNKPITRRTGSSKNFAEYTVGTKVWLRDNNEKPYEVIYKTETHVVLLLEGSTEPRSLSESTFFFKGPSLTQRTVVTEVQE